MRQKRRKSFIYYFIYASILHVCQRFLCFLCSPTIQQNWWILWCRTSEPPRPKPQTQWGRTVQTSPQWKNTYTHSDLLSFSVLALENVLLCNTMYSQWTRNQGTVQKPVCLIHLLWLTLFTRALIHSATFTTVESPRANNGFTSGRMLWP